VLLPGFDSTTLQQAEGVLGTFSNYQKSATALEKSLQAILSAPNNFALPQPQGQTVTEAKTACEALEDIFQSQNAPDLSQIGDTSPLDNLTQQIQDWFLDGGGDALEEQIQTGLASLISQLTPSQNNSLLGTFENLYSNLIAISDKLATQLSLSSNIAGGERNPL
jgi:hypothetical protein